MAIARFELYHTVQCETIARIEMDVELLKPEAGIMDQDTFMLRNIKNGKLYTLVPLEEANHTVAVLRRVYETYQSLTTKPCASFNTLTARMDNFVSIVGLMFGEVEYLQVESAQDLEHIINQPKDYQPKAKKYTVLGDLLGEIKSKQSDLVGSSSDT